MHVAAGFMPVFKYQRILRRYLNTGIKPAATCIPKEASKVGSPACPRTMASLGGNNQNRQFRQFIHSSYDRRYSALVIGLSGSTRLRLVKRNGAIPKTIDRWNR